MTPGHSRCGLGEWSTLPRQVHRTIRAQLQLGLNGVAPLMCSPLGVSESRPWGLEGVRHKGF